jgi:hypothetical protein
LLTRRCPCFPDRRPDLTNHRLGEVAAHYTLLEPLDAIYYELSFYGATPERRRVFADELDGQALDEA